MKQFDRIRHDVNKFKAAGQMPDEITMHPATAEIVKKQAKQAAKIQEPTGIKISTDFGIAKTVVALKLNGKLIGMVDLESSPR